MIKLVIVEDNVQLAQLTAQFLSGQGCEVLGTACDGDAGLHMICSRRPDVAIIDLLLPGKDGFYILEELTKQPEFKPICIMLSGVGLPSITAQAFEKGADYFVLKPFDMELLARRVVELWNQRNATREAGLGVPAFISRRKTPEEFVLDVLHSILIPNTLNGYFYIKTALLLSIDDITMLDGVTKRLYPAIARHHKSTGVQVERAIRHAIDSAWKKGGGKAFTGIIGYGDPQGSKPTNSAFIASLVECYQHNYN